MNVGTVVVDASALVAAVVGGDAVGEQARALLRDQRRAAPFLIDAEVGSALRFMAMRGDLAEGVAAVARLTAERLIHDRHPHHGAVSARAWQLRDRVSFYDALYVALAESLRCPLITADRRLSRALKGHDLINTIASGT